MGWLQNGRVRGRIRPRQDWAHPLMLACVSCTWQLLMLLLPPAESRECSGEPVPALWWQLLSRHTDSFHIWGSERCKDSLIDHLPRYRSGNPSGQCEPDIAYEAIGVIQLLPHSGSTCCQAGSDCLLLMPPHIWQHRPLFISLHCVIILLGLWGLHSDLLISITAISSSSVDQCGC